MYLVGFIIRIYHDAARSPELKISLKYKFFNETAVVIVRNTLHIYKNKHLSMNVSSTQNWGGGSDLCCMFC